VRAYLRLDPHASDRKSDYPDGAFRAFFETLCHAEQQPQRGRFRNRKLLAVLLEKRARWIPYLIEHGDLVETESGKLYVDGWDEWQEGDVTVSERMRRLRSRQKGVTPTDTPTVTPPTVTQPSSGGGSAGGKHSAEAGGSHAAPFMGFRPKASSEDVRRQDEEAWSKCAQCGVVGRKHPASGDHPFRPLRSVS
jgi:hypothetical protein